METNKITTANSECYPQLRLGVQVLMPVVAEFIGSAFVRLVYLLVFLPLVALGMSPREPEPEVYASHRGRFIVRIEPGKYTKKPTASSNATARVFEFKPSPKTFEPRGTFKLENEILPVKMLISEDGSRIVAVDDWFNQNHQKPVIVIHDASGAVIKRLYLHDILSSEEIGEIKPPQGKQYWLPWNIDVLLMWNSNKILVLRDHIMSGPGKKYDNYIIDLRTFKVSKEKVD